MEWWQILIAIVFNVPWLYIFFACVLAPIIKSIDKEQFVTTVLSINAVVAALSGVVLFFAILIALLYGDDLSNAEVLPPTLLISGIIFVITLTITIITIKPRNK